MFLESSLNFFLESQQSGTYVGYCNLTSKRLIRLSGFLSFQFSKYFGKTCRLMEQSNLLSRTPQNGTFNSNGPWITSREGPTPCLVQFFIRRQSPDVVLVLFILPSWNTFCVSGRVQGKSFPSKLLCPKKGSLLS